jgi:DNA end-binding protein Ku
MAARPYWQGQIRLALVSIPVEIYSATKSGATVSFHQIHEPSGKRIRYEKVVPGIGPVDPEEIVKGYEYEKGKHVLLEEAEIDAVKLESKKTLDLSLFVDEEGIDPIYYEKPYYVVPADDLAEEAFIVLRDALRKSHKIGLGQLALRGREYIVSLKPCGRGMVLETLRYSDEVNKATPFFRDIPDAKPDPELLDLAATLIEKKSGEFNASEYHDRYVDALKELIERKKKGATIETEEETPAPSRGANVVDLMAALKRSLDRPEAANDRGAAKAPAKKAPAKKPAAAKAKAPARKRA